MHASQRSSVGSGISIHQGGGGLSLYSYASIYVSLEYIISQFYPVDIQWAAVLKKSQLGKS